ncbi:hypothetical protein Mucpa_5411 [Mucilaginibacter paludis DSM 18603]|uniref:Uncharacterized protein n=1 Tax=Mucilaginibacter paludis DSM 18603 TaxID=714943 RepID=H1Y9A5_9SPHI|nr:hypothetical protein Mucpa_5411 [Mucilaginibacter paludis DSM 18603]
MAYESRKLEIPDKKEVFSKRLCLFLLEAGIFQYNN